MANYVRYLSHMKRLVFKFNFSDRFVFRLFLAGIAILQLPNALTLAGALTDTESLMALGRVGANKQTYLNMVCVVLAVGLSLAVLRGDGRRSLPRRIGLCLLLWGVLATFSVNFRQARFYQERQHGTLRTLAIASERLIVRELGVLRSLDDFAQEIKDLRPESFEILRDRIRVRKISDDPALSGLPKDARDVAHYMVAVSRLWAFGNEKESSKVGCVLQNEATAFQSVAFSGLGKYLDGPIGCCTDYAYTLKRLLELEGWENRLVETPGHVFN